MQGYLVVLVGIPLLTISLGCRRDTIEGRKKISQAIQKHAEDLRTNPTSETAWDSYREHLYSSWRFERIYATGALVDMGLAEPRAVEELIKLLSCGDSGVEKEAASTLGDIGPRAQSAMPELMECAQGSDLVMQQKSIRAIGRIAEPTPEVIELLKRAENSDSEIVRETAKVALQTLENRNSG